jgi:hypothetical protein
MHSGGTVTVATPFQAAVIDFGFVLDGAKAVLGRREWEAFVDVVCIRVAAEASSLMWREAA